MTDERNRTKSPWVDLRGTLLPNCREMSVHASHSLDVGLNPFQRLGVGLHLIFCRFCRRYWRQLRWLRLTARRSADAIVVVTPLSDPARHRLKQSLREEMTLANAPGTEASPRPREPRTGS